ncbi:TonB-dependent receptor [Woodsholea maritima]|uniref:TonB-dependent receptor n=1 Tax=Woodsholea maritima TaxID=240237 RepID=UPI000373A5CB|nr:TonB-dependent receptor [Woodsholea maritima]
MVKHKTCLKAALLLSSVAFAPMMAAPVYAQSDEAAVQDRIVVTARRREESLQDTPVAVSAFTGDMLEDTGAVDITDLQENVPNVTVEVARGTNSTLIAFIRGVGQQDPLWGFEPGVGLYVDDVYVARPQGSVLDIFDVERVEVLRGPQGTLYGRNTIGGAIRYVTKRLDMDAPQARANISAGSYNQLDYSVSGSVPISDTFAIGGAYARYRHDGYGQNLTTGADHYNKDVEAFRISAEWAPTDRFFARFAFDQTQDDSNAKHGHRLIPGILNGEPVTDDIYDTRAGLGDKNSVETKGYSLALEYEINDSFTFKSITAYREGKTETPIDFDGLPGPTFDVPAYYKDDQITQEFQLLFNHGRWSGVAGLYYIKGNAEGAFDAALTASTVLTAGDVETKSYSAFADVTYEVNDQWSVSVGGRWTSDEKTADVLRQIYLGLYTPRFGNPNATPFGAPLSDFTGNRTDDKFSPRVSVNWEPTDDLSLYASYSQGFKGGGFDPRGLAGPEGTVNYKVITSGFAPEIVDSYEIGLKGYFFDGNLMLNTALFLADYSDQQITVQEGADSDNDGTNDTFVSTVFNAGKSQYKGIEVEFLARVNENFNITGMIGLIDADIEEIIDKGVNVADDYVTQNTPETTASIAFNYTRDLHNDWGDISANLGLSYRSDFHIFNVANPGFPAGTIPNLPNTPLPALDPDSVTLVNANLVWNSDNEKWRVGLHGRNLSDEAYKVAGYSFPTTGADGVYSSFYGAPRTWTISVGYKY